MHKGVWQCPGDRDGAEPNGIEVAVKSLTNTATQDEKVKFLQEAAIMGQFSHPYILQIFGIMLSDNKVMVCMFLSKPFTNYYHL